MSGSSIPLRYPGGKSSLLKYVQKFIVSYKISVEAIIEPYAGSAAISMGLLRKGLISKAFINDSDQMIYAFWKTLLNNNQELIEMIDAVQVNLDTWLYYRKYLIEKPLRIYNEKEVAMAFLFLNRTSYSGIVKAGPLGGKKQQSQNKIDCRFNKQNLKNKIKILEEFSPRVEVSNMDGIQFMKEIIRTNEDVFIYADPPYYKVGKLLYNQYFNDNKHIELANYLKQVDEQPWLLSYNNSDFILNLYSDQKMVPIFLDYHSGPYRRNITEYLFSNRVIPPFEVGDEMKNRNLQEHKRDSHFTISEEA